MRIQKERKVERKIEAVEACESTASPSVNQRTWALKDHPELQLRKSQAVCTHIFKNFMELIIYFD
jgi:hypothetical protein